MCRSYPAASARIDEHFFSRKKGYATTLVDLKHHKVFDVVLGRSEASLRSYLKRLPGREHVRVIVMDLSETYRRIAQEYFPNAMIVADQKVGDVVVLSVERAGKPREVRVELQPGA